MSDLYKGFIMHYDCVRVSVMPIAVLTVIYITHTPTHNHAARCRQTDRQQSVWFLSRTPDNVINANASTL